MKIERRTVQFHRDTANLFFHILTRCNLKCRHCYINPAQHGAGILDQETIQAWLHVFAGGKRMDRHGKIQSNRQARDINLVFLGGEPTMNPALPEAIKTARGLGYASVTVDTNGYLFHDILDKVTPEEVDYFSFSLDGSTPKVNDAIRGKGSFDACTRGLARAGELGFSVSVIFTASRMNIEDLEYMPALLEGFGVKRFFIQVIGIRGNPAKQGEDRLQLKRDEWESIVPDVAARAARKGMHCTYPKVFLSLEEEFACAGLVADNFFVFPNGRVYTCPLCEDYPIHAYEIRKDVLKERQLITERDLYALRIPEGCVMNRVLHPGNIPYDELGNPIGRIACCMLKEEVLPAGGRA